MCLCVEENENMQFDYDKVAQRYDGYRRGGGPFLRCLVELAKDAQRVLEVGPGTGNNTQAFLEQHPGNLIALDHSRGMLDIGREKVPQARWLLGDVEHLPFPEAAFDYAFGVYVLHHLQKLEFAFQQCHRVLKPGATLAFVTAPISYIQRHPMNAYFPSFSKADLERFQSVKEIVSAMKSAGFKPGVHYCVEAPKPIDNYYVDRVANKFISSLDLIPEDEFTEGLARLRADVTMRGRLNVAIEWESVVVWGTK